MGLNPIIMPVFSLTFDWFPYGIAKSEMVGKKCPNNPDINL